MLGGVFMLLTVLAVSILIFLLIRGILLWYWRVNDIVNNQSAQSMLLQEQVKLLAEQNELLKSLKVQLGNNPINPNQIP